ncbi:hypothetical protein [Candidatus Symbiopectobacterium sp. PLON1]|uniref:hypothetical protein n=1 Tax=Candidatus Symbiopectobacterium sp. PLON1 TaxID=2794575 RepID=UPI0025BCCB10|nr:hypothetical protein [Candidatus Symbiopectobacterium sp. PLON1]
MRYRIARRDAHNSDAELASVVANMSSEPHAIRNTLDDAFRFMCLNHTLLSYISTLGAHREKLALPQTLQLLDDAICYIDAALHHPDIDVQTQREGLLARQQQVQQLAPDPDSKEQLVLQQIGLIIDVLPELTQLKGTIR